MLQYDKQSNLHRPSINYSSGAVWVVRLVGGLWWPSPARPQPVPGRPGVGRLHPVLAWSEMKVMYEPGSSC